MAKTAKRRGKWVVDWYDRVTKRRSREVCADRDAAKRRLGEVLKSGERVGLKSTLRKYGDKWLEHMKDELAASTYQEYAAVLRNHVYPVLGDKPFSKITRAMIRDLISAKRKEDMTLVRSETYLLRYGACITRRLMTASLSPIRLREWVSGTSA